MTNYTPRSAEPGNEIQDFARRLAEVHRGADGGDSRILVSWTDVEVRLIEIADHFPPSEILLPFHFAAQPDKNIPYESVILLHNTDTWESVSDKSVLLPEGWNIEEFRELADLD